MKIWKQLHPEVDYRQFRFSKINSQSYSHMKLLLYWPFFGILFFYLERLQSGRNYFVMHCLLDDLIPFCEWALIPYLFWFIFLIGALVYTFLYDTRAFRRMMYFVIVTYSITLIVYIIFPTCQNLRPASFPRRNLLIAFIELFYKFDTSTNVCPSLHVVGSFAAMFAFWDTRRFRHSYWKVTAAILTLSISLSTVFMKQHSALDVLAALPICALGWHVVYGKKPNCQRRPLHEKANFV